ncbi:MAG TPA: hypothetical protein VKY90_12610 [Candidatus Dormibacteraeota bacterium]|nr:hypothetical protein [Candidatus Dormibacteraeota bacterium]
MSAVNRGLTCPVCGLGGLPAGARFCARCGRPLAAPERVLPRPPGAPIWVLVLLWLGAVGLLVVAVVYGVVAVGLVPVRSAAPGTDPASIRAASAVLAGGAASLCLAHGVAAVALSARRSWSRPLATLVCATWILTCVGLPVGLLAIDAIWRARRDGGPAPVPPA